MPFLSFFFLSSSFFLFSMRYELALFIGFVVYLFVCLFLFVFAHTKIAINILTIIITFAVESEQVNASMSLLTVSMCLHDIKSQFGLAKVVEGLTDQVVRPSPYGPLHLLL